MKKKNGFTLIELLSTIIILGIVATIAIQAYIMLVTRNDGSKYKYYWNFIEKSSDLYFDARKTSMIDGECFSVNYQELVDKNYLKEEGVTCTGNIILKKQNKKYIYDDTNIECRSNKKTLKEKGKVEAVCPVTESFVFDDNYERLNNIATNMTASIDKWKNVSTTHIVKKGYDLASAKNISFAMCSGECGIYQTLTSKLIPDKTYSFSVFLKANSGKTLKVGVGTTGLKQVTTTGNWQKISGKFIATSADDSRFSILSTSGFQANEEIYINSVIVYEKSMSLKNKLAFEPGVVFGDRLPTPKRVGYEFAGWSTTPTGGDKITKNTVVPKTKNITYYAQWTKKHTKVNYLSNGGSGNTASDTVTYGDDYTIKNNMFTKTGYTFKNWKDNDNSKDFSIWQQTPITWLIDKDINLSAIWTKNKYIITFNANGGSVSQSSKTVTYDSTYGTLPTPTRSGYTFTGWYTATSGGTKIESTTKVKITADQTLYARWKANNYTVTFNANGGSVSQSSKTVTYDSTYGTLPTPTRNGYSFIGWFDEKYKDKSLNYYADTYKDLYNAYGYNQEKLYHHWSNYGIKEGRRASQYISTDKVVKASNHTLYVGWVANQYNVVYHANGGTWSGGTTWSNKATYGKPYVTEPNWYTAPAGYVFNGWNEKADGSGSSWKDWIGREWIWSYTRDVNLYAQWKKKSFSTSGELYGFPTSIADGSYRGPDYNVSSYKTCTVKATATKRDINGNPPPSSYDYGYVELYGPNLIKTIILHADTEREGSYTFSPANTSGYVHIEGRGYVGKVTYTLTCS